MFLRAAPPIPPQDIAFSLEQLRLKEQWERQLRKQQQGVLQRSVADEHALLKSEMDSQTRLRMSLSQDKE